MAEESGGEYMKAMEWEIRKRKVTLSGQLKIDEPKKHVKKIRVKPSLVVRVHRSLYTRGERLDIDKFMESTSREKWVRMEGDPAMGHLFEIKTILPSTVKKMNDYKAKM